MAKKEKKLLSGMAKIAPPEPGKPLKVVFEPGCFDHIDVESQEELDRLMSEITDMFANITPEELEASSRLLTDEDIDDMDPEEQEAVLKALEQDAEQRRKQLN